MLALNCFTVVRDESPLFAPVTQRFASNDLWLIKGPNGRGKSSLLRSLAGVYPHYTGDIVMESSQAPAYFGHFPATHGGMTLLENLQQLHDLYGLSLADLDRLLLSLELMGLEDIPLGRLSAGQKRKVALSPLFHQDLVRCVWLLDEPFTSLDVATCELIERQLEQHIQKGGLVLLTSHQPLQSTTLQGKIKELPLEAPV